MSTNTNRTVGELVAERPERSRVFEKYGIDYCCGGRKSLADACADAGASLQTVTSELTVAVEGDSTTAKIDWTTRPMGELIYHIVVVHHAFLRRELPRLSTMAEKVSHAHGHRHRWLGDCARLLGALRAELESHMMKEEQVLFPMILELDMRSAAAADACGSLQSAIGVMEDEHQSAGNALAQMRALSDGFSPPDDACNTLRAWLQGLHELETDLHEHIHKENNILFPRALEREAMLEKAAR